MFRDLVLYRVLWWTTWPDKVTKPIVSSNSFWRGMVCVHLMLDLKKNQINMTISVDHLNHGDDMKQQSKMQAHKHINVISSFIIHLLVCFRAIFIGKSWPTMILSGTNCSIEFCSKAFYKFHKSDLKAYLGTQNIMRLGTRPQLCDA